MSEPASDQRHSGVIPSLVVTPCAEAIEFYKKAFDATEIEPRLVGPDGSVGHAEISIGGSVIMMGDQWPNGATVSPSTLGGTTMALFINTDDVDTLWEQALAAGAEVVYPLELQFYGDKSGRLQDPFGHQWALSQHVEDVAPEEMERRIAEFYAET